MSSDYTLYMELCQYFFNTMNREDVGQPVSLNRLARLFLVFRVYICKYINGLNHTVSNAGLSESKNCCSHGKR